MKIEPTENHYLPNALLNLVNEGRWDEAALLYDCLHADGATPLPKDFETKRNLILLGLQSDVTLNSAYFYGGLRDGQFNQAVNFLKVAIRVGGNSTTPDRANAVLETIVKGCTELLPESFRDNAVREAFQTAIRIGYPRAFLLESPNAKEYKRLLIETDLDM